ncbi:nucleotide excision repair TFIIH subunit [Mrakia frigida]|uniref:TFIIH complex subunit TFB5 n=1 Tax=Mrakia frigida TaxID=29902 RepID=UPI003FCBF9CD
MPVATKGTLVTCDEAVKQILIWQNEQLSSQDQFIIMDLDPRHLLVKTSEVETIEAALNMELEKNHYDPKGGQD